MADANARKQAIKQASQQVRAGTSAFVRRANAGKSLSSSPTTGRPVSSPQSPPKK